MFIAVWMVLDGLMQLGLTHARTEFDQNLFHLRVIEQFAEEWPRFSLGDYQSATTPGYHIALATVCRFLTGETLALRIISGGATAALIAAMVLVLSRYRPIAECLILALPLLLSQYVLQSGLYLLPDNSAWLLVVTVLGIALCPRQRPAHWFSGGVALCLLVLTRQIHLWAAAALWAGALFWPGPYAPARWREQLAKSTDGRPLTDLMGGFNSAFIAGVMTLPAFAIVGWFVKLWGGLTPPTFQRASADAGESHATNVVGASPATPAFMLALLAIYLLPMLPLIWSRLRFLWTNDTLTRALVSGGAAAGFLAAALPITTHLSRPRVGGLWNIVRALDKQGVVLLGRTSPLILILATIGGAMTVGVLLAGRTANGGRHRWVLLVALLGFMAAGTAQSLSWQRYFEPFLLIWVALAVASRQVGTSSWFASAPASGGAPVVLSEAERGPPGLWRPAWFLGPVALAGLMLVVSILAFSGQLG